MEVVVTIRIDPEIAKQSAAAQNLRDLLVLLAARLLEASINHRDPNHSRAADNTPTGGC